MSGIAHYYRNPEMLDSSVLRLATKALDQTHAVAGRPYYFGALPQVSEHSGDFIAPLLDIAVPVGQAEAAQLATSVHTQGVTNIFHEDLSPGGSSGGSAVAVATGEADIATATDAGGSIRIPAAHAGLFAIKPTPGLVPKEQNDWEGLSVSGIIAPNVELTASLLDRISGATADEPYKFSKYLTSDLPPQKVKVINNYFGEDIDERNTAAIEESMERLRRYGHTVDDTRDEGFGIDKIYDKAGISEAFVILMATSVARAIAEAETATRLLADRSVLTDSNWALREMGRDYANDVIRAKDQMYSFGADYRRLLGDDILLLPTLGNPTPKQSDMEPSRLLVAGAVAVSALSRKMPNTPLNKILGTAKTSAKHTPIMTAAANLASVPAATTPVTSTVYAGKLVPVSVQTVAPQQSDNRLVGLSSQLMR